LGNAVAIAAVTSTVCYLLEQSLAAHPDGVDLAQVTTMTPGELAASLAGNDAVPGLNVFLYAVEPSPGLRSPVLPPRRRDGTPGPASVATVTLRLLVTAYGEEALLEPHRLIARAVLALTATPFLTGDLITEAMTHWAARPGLQFLAKADLVGQVEPVRLAPEVLAMEDVRRLWAMFGAPYLLSTAYTANAVVLGDE
jgi:hypothetical protein